MGFVWPSEPVPCVNQDLSQCSIKRFLPLPLHFLSPFLSPFGFFALWRVRSRCPCPPFIGAAAELGLGRGCKNRNHVVSNGRVFVQRIVEVPILLVDELAVFFHQKAISGHEFGQIRRAEPAVGCVLMGRAGQQFGVKCLVRCQMTPPQSAKALLRMCRIRLMRQRPADKEALSICGTSSQHI